MNPEKIFEKAWKSYEADEYGRSLKFFDQAIKLAKDGAQRDRFLSGACKAKKYFQKAADKKGELGIDTLLKRFKKEPGSFLPVKPILTGNPADKTIRGNFRKA